MRLSGWAVAGVTLLCVPGAGACRKAATAPSTPTASTTIRLTTSGISPKSVQIALGERVLFVNNDTQNHEMGSDPHPDHTDCPVMNQVGLLKPGEQRETGNFVVVRTCGFHDHLRPSDTSVQGTVVTR